MQKTAEILHGEYLSSESELYLEEWFLDFEARVRVEYVFGWQRFKIWTVLQMWFIFFAIQVKFSLLIEPSLFGCLVNIRTGHPYSGQNSVRIRSGHHCESNRCTDIFSKSPVENRCKIKHKLLHLGTRLKVNFYRCDFCCQGTDWSNWSLAEQELGALPSN